MPYLQEFYIIPVGGNLIYAKSGNNRFDNDLFSGFLSALNSFSMGLFSQDLLSFSLQDSKYITIKVNELLFVARTNTKAKNSEIQQVLNEMQEIFFKHFPPASFKKGWGGNVEQFAILNKLYDPYFAGSSEKALKAIW